MNYKILSLFLGLSIALMNCTSQAIIWARTFWTNSKGQVVEVWYDHHAEYFTKNVSRNFQMAEKEQEALLVSNCVENIKSKQRKDTLAYFLSYTKDIHGYIEDIYPLCKEEYPDLFELPYSFLYGLDHIFQQGAIPYTNVEFRKPEVNYDIIHKEVLAYSDGPELAHYYKELNKWKKELKQYLFDARLVHALHSGAQKGLQRQVFIGGGAHGLSLSVALSLMGYTQDKDKTVVSRELQRILNSPETTELERLIRDNVLVNLGSSFIDLIRHGFGGDWYWWTSAFLVTNPIDISSLRAHDERIDKERMARATEAESKELASQQAPSPIRSRL